MEGEDVEGFVHEHFHVDDAEVSDAGGYTPKNLDALLAVLRDRGHQPQQSLVFSSYDDDLAELHRFHD